jgi:RNA polymerase sigma-70 factor (ECF subfamily)
MNQESVWIEAARQGDRAAFGQLVQAYQGPVFNLTYRMLGDRAEAEEAAQEAFLRAFTKLHSFDPDQKFNNWLLSITSHYCIDRLRRRRFKWISLGSERLPRDAMASHEPDPEQCMVRAESRAAIQGLLDGLPTDYRAAVVLHYWYDLSYEEIAEATGSTVSAIKSRLFRARRKLAERAQKTNLMGTEVLFGAVTPLTP